MANRQDVLAGSAEWWRDAVIYQVYPRSFQDTNGDGIGDLEGVRRRLAYIRELGADAVWICPFVRSPMRDMGYDVSDYCAVEPMFGTLNDFDAVLHEAHELGLRIIIDQVWNHTSDQHPWFLESRRDKHNPKADFYVWADTASDGGPPNNWRATFGGSAWTFDEQRRQYYLHNFLAEQPDLNWYNPDVRRALLEVGRFWLLRGVDGFRLDVVNFYTHDRTLQDNPPRPPERERPHGASPNDPYFAYIPTGTVSRPETWPFLAEIRALMDEFPGRVALGEISSAEDAVATAAQFVQGQKRLHTAYNAALISHVPFRAPALQSVISRAVQSFAYGSACWTLGTHDFPRLKGRWHHHSRYEDELEKRLDELLLSLLIALPGSLCIYQGDELGLPQAQLSFEQLRDPFGIANHGLVESRDGCRTPMPWSESAPHAGFTQGEPWLPIPVEHLALAVDRQTRDSRSLLSSYRQMLAFRRREPAFHQPALRFIDAAEPVLSFARGEGPARLVCVFNLGPDALECTLPGALEVAQSPLSRAALAGGVLRLGGFGCAFLKDQGSLGGGAEAL